MNRIPHRASDLEAHEKKMQEILGIYDSSRNVNCSFVCGVSVVFVGRPEAR